MNNNQSNTIWSFVPSSVTTAYDYTGGGHPQMISVSAASSSTTTISSPFQFVHSTNGGSNYSANATTNNVNNDSSVDGNGAGGATDGGAGALELIAATDSSNRDYVHPHHNNLHHHHHHHIHNNQQHHNRNQQQNLHENSSPFLSNTGGGSRTAAAAAAAVVAGGAFLCDYMVHQPPLPLDTSDGNFLRSSTFNAAGLSAAYSFPADASHWPAFSTQEFADTFFVDSTLSSFIPTGEFMPHALGPTNPFGCTGRFVPPFETMGPTPPKRRTGGRRPKEEECKLPPEEEEKRRLRRQRNKEAAARCRKRRLDQMNTLEVKVSELQSHQTRLEAELDRLLQEKQEMEFILKSHESICQCRDIKQFSTIVSQMKSDYAKSDGDDDTMEEDDKPDPTLSSVVVVSVRGGKSGGSKDCIVDVASGGLLARPSTLPISDIPIMTPSFDQTPSRAFVDLFNQPTGLTPMTIGGLTPLLAATSTMAGQLPSLETPSVTEAKGLPNNFTKL